MKLTVSDTNINKDLDGQFENAMYLGTNASQCVLGLCQNDLQKLIFLNRHVIKAMPKINARL